MFYKFTRVFGICNMEYVTDAVDHGKPVDVIYGLPKKHLIKYHIGGC